MFIMKTKKKISHLYTSQEIHYTRSFKKIQYAPKLRVNVNDGSASQKENTFSCLEKTTAVSTMYKSCMNMYTGFALFLG